MKSNKIIKFRAIDEFSDEFIYGQAFFIDTDNNQGYISNGTSRNYLVKKETVGQYIGLLDKNGIEIYEGDFVNHRYTKENGGVNDYVVYDGLEYTLNNLSYQNWANHEWYNTIGLEVIGNIHQNKELLK